MVLSIRTRLAWRLQSLIILSQFVKQEEQGKWCVGVGGWVGGGFATPSEVKEIKMTFYRKQKRWYRKQGFQKSQIVLFSEGTAWT